MLNRNVIILPIIILLSFFYSGYSTSIEVGGHITTNTNWNVDTVKVIDTLIVDDGIVLTISPGTRVEFQDHYQFIVNGCVRAIGASDDSITFTIYDTTGFGRYDTTAGGWNAIRFENVLNSNDTSILSYCNIEYGKAYGELLQNKVGGAFYIINFSKIRISNCNITNNKADHKGGAFYCNNTSATVINSTISNNTQGAFWCVRCTSLVIKDNIISDNDRGYSGGSGIHCDSFCIMDIEGNQFLRNTRAIVGGAINSKNSNLRLLNNVFIENSAENGGGACRFYSNAYSSTEVINCLFAKNNGGLIAGAILSGIHGRFTNCTIAGNRADKGGGVSCFSNSNVFTNCIIYDNVAGAEGNQVNLYYDTCDPGFFFCDIEGGKEAFGGDGSGAFYTGAYESNVDKVPQFVDTLNGDWSVEETSPCVNNGTPDTTGLNLPVTDIAGNPRIFNGMRIDMGAFEYQGNPVKPILSLNPESFSHIVPADSSHTFTCQLQNIGADGLIIDSVRLFSGTSFTITKTIPDNTVINAMGKDSIKVTINQNTLDVVTDTLIIYNNDEIKKVIVTVIRGTIIDTDTVSGTWLKKNSPYFIYHTVLIPNTLTLTIEAGSEVIFTAPFFMEIQGRLLAQGSSTDSITFTVEDTTGFGDDGTNRGGWRGIRFKNTPAQNDSSLISYCILEYGKARGVGDSACGGAILVSGFSKVRVNNCSIRNNYAYRFGGGIYCYNAAPLFISNRITKNRTKSGGAGVGIGDHSYVVVKDNIIEYNHGLWSFSDGGGGIYARNAFPHIEGNIIRYNYSEDIGGGISLYNSVATVINNEIAFDTAQGGEGGGIHCHNGASKFIQNVIHHNRAMGGGGIYCSGVLASQIISNTIANNHARDGGGLGFEYKNNSIVINCILYGNDASWEGQQGYLFSEDCAPEFKYNDIQDGLSGLDGVGPVGNLVFENNINIYPAFVDSAAGNWALQEMSLCRNKGNPDLTGLGIPATDFAGMPRVSEGIIDIGAYEYQGPIGIQSETGPVIQREKFNAYPNPSADTPIHFAFYTTKNLEFYLSIYDAVGNRILKKRGTIYAQQGSCNSFFTWDPPGYLACGQYLAVLKTYGQKGDQNVYILPIGIKRLRR